MYKDSSKPAEEQEDYFTIKYNKITPVVIEALKHTMKRVKVLEDELSEVKKKLATFKDGDSGS